MKKIIFLMLSIILLFSGTTVSAAQAPTANAGPDLYVNTGQTIVLQGSGYDADGGTLTYYWNCSGGTLSGYNIAQPTYTAPSSSQNSYNCSLTATDNTSLSGSDSMVVYTSNSGSGSGTLLITKKVINLTSGNLNWSTSVNAKPLDVLSFAITMQANGNQDVHNIYIRDILPANLIYKESLMLNTTLNYSGNPVSGINIGTISAGNVAVLSYQAQVANYSTLAYGTSVLTNSATITSTEAGTQTASASVFVNNSLVYGATNIATGLTNNFLTESFFLPMLLIVLGSWLYLSGKIYVFAGWLKQKI